MKEVKEKDNRRVNTLRVTLAGIVFFFIVTIVIVGSCRGNMSMLLEAAQYIEKYEVTLCFFKDIDYRAVDDFSAEDLTLLEGEKANAYEPLTSKPKVINLDYLNEQIDVINTLIDEEYYNNWNRLAGDIIANYQGISTIRTQIGEAERGRKRFLIESVQYMGLSLSELQAKRQVLAEMLNGLPRDLALKQLGLLSSGYVHTSIKPIEKTMCESMLPYINTTFLKVAGRVDQESEQILKVVNNDHIYMAFSMPSNLTLMGEERVADLKTELMGTSDGGVNKDYFELLIKRVDRLYAFPELRFEYNEKVYSSFLVDIAHEGNQKVVVLMLKDYVNDFTEVVIADSSIYIQDYSAYEVPKSAVFEVDNETVVEVVSKGYFSEPLPVVVEKQSGNNVVLRTRDNPYLNSGSRISVYP